MNQRILDFKPNGSSDSDYLRPRLRAMFSELIGSAEVHNYLQLSHTDFLERLRETIYQPLIDFSLLQKTPAEAIDRALHEKFVNRILQVLRITKGRPHRTFNLIVSRWNYLLIDITISALNGSITLSNHHIPVIDSSLYQSLKEARSINEVISRISGRFPKAAELLDDLVETEQVLQFKSIALQHLYLKQVKAMLNEKKYFSIFEDMIQAEIEKYHIELALRLNNPRYNQNEWIKLLDYTVKHRSSNIVTKFLDDHRTISGRYYSNILEKIRTANKGDLYSLLSDLHGQMMRKFIKIQARRKYKNSLPQLLVAYYWQGYRELHNIQSVNHGLQKGLETETIEELIW